MVTFCIRPVKEFETLNNQDMKHLNRITTLHKPLKPLLVLCGVIGRFLYNPIYGGRKSLYGAGVFPFWIYIKYFGKPVYKKARKIGANTYFSLMSANILGSLAHVNFFINGTASTILWFIGSLILFSGIFFGIHKLNAL